MQLCRHHLRLVHEGGFSCERDAERTVIFRDEFGEIIPEMGYRPLPHRDIVIDLKKQLQDRFIHSKTCVTRWDGEIMDQHLAVGLLCDLDDKQTLTDSHTV